MSEETAALAVTVEEAPSLKILHDDIENGFWNELIAVIGKPQEFLKKGLALFQPDAAAGIHHLCRAAKTYVIMLNQCPSVQDKFEAAFPHYSRDSWTEMEAVGRGFMDSRLMLMGGGTRDRVKRLPPAVQKQILDRGVQVSVKGGKKTEHLLVPVRDLTPAQAQQSIDRDKLRTLEEQQIYLKDQAADARRRLSAPGYQVRDGKLVVLKPRKFTAAELVDILGRLQGETA